MKINIPQKITLSAYAFIVLFWFYLQVNQTHLNNVQFNYWYSFLFGLIPLIGGAIGIKVARRWGGLKSIIGKGIFFFSLGLFLWGFGESIWSYYNFFEGEPAPYPSIADMGFAPSIFFWILGTIYFAKATGAIYAFKANLKAKVYAVLVPVILLVFSYVLLVTIARGGMLVPPGETPLKVILDIAYPLGDFLALSIALTVFSLSRKYLGGYYRNSVAALFIGLIIMYFGDFIFSYTTTLNTFYNGNFGDLLLASGTAFMTFGILGFSSKPLSSNSYISSGSKN